jgi:flagellar protein FliS
MHSYGRGALGYRAVEVATGIATANSIQLTQMLFDGLVESLNAAKGHVRHGSMEEKARALSRAGRILGGLQEGLDFQRGGELAKNLNELYLYVSRRLVHVNAYNDVGALEEICSLMSEIRVAWKSLDGLVPQRVAELMIA